MVAARSHDVSPWQMGGTAKAQGCREGDRRRGRWTDPPIAPSLRSDRDGVAAGGAAGASSMPAANTVRRSCAALDRARCGDRPNGLAHRCLAELRERGARRSAWVPSRLPRPHPGASMFISLYRSWIIERYTGLRRSITGANFRSGSCLARPTSSTTFIAQVVSRGEGRVVLPVDAHGCG